MTAEETVLYAEDFAMGDAFEFGSHTVTEQEIIEFATEFDPQPFHVDLAAARESMFGGLVASGWHVVSRTNRLLTDALYLRMALRGGRGIDDLAFHRPTRPGDTLSGIVRVAETADRPEYPRSRDVSFDVTTENDRDETVLTMTNHAIVKRRAEN